MVTVNRSQFLENTKFRGGAARIRFRLSVVLAFSIGTLVLLAVLAVLALQVRANVKNTLDLLNDKAQFILKSVERDVASHLNPVREQVEFIARQIEDGAYDITDRKQLGTLLTGALAPLPQVDRIVVVDPNRRAFGIRRNPDHKTEVIERIIEAQPIDTEAHQNLMTTKGIIWGRLVHRNGETFLTVQRALRRDGNIIGFIGAGVSTTELSRVADETGALLSQPTGNNGSKQLYTAFILYGPNNVLAHPNLTSDSSLQSDKKPAISIFETGDIVLSELWNGVPISGFEQAAAEDVNVVGVTLGDIDYVALYKWVYDYGEIPWAIGVWSEAGDHNTELLRLNFAALAGLAIALVAVLAAILVGRQIAKPIHRVSLNALKIGNLDLNEIEILPPSRIRELDDEATAFNTMLAGLRSFETYVPRTIVARLMHAGGDRVESTQRRVAIMFTDIVGYTAASENLSATEVAEFLNNHFSTIGNCVENEGGTIDKFIGDSLMAFWGAPDDQEQIEQRACRTAIAIANALALENEERRARGQDSVRLRIGIHTGDVVVGNIGAPGRINYTIVGDTVNLCQRLEALGKEVDPTAEFITLISKPVRDALDADFPVQPVGTFDIDGRTGKAEVFRLIA